MKGINFSPKDWWSDWIKKKKYSYILFIRHTSEKQHLKNNSEHVIPFFRTLRCLSNLRELMPTLYSGLQSLTWPDPSLPNCFFRSLCSKPRGPLLFLFPSILDDLSLDICLPTILVVFGSLIRFYILNEANWDHSVHVTNSVLLTSYFLILL